MRPTRSPLNASHAEVGQPLAQKLNCGIAKRSKAPGSYPDESGVRIPFPLQLKEIYAI